MMSGKPSRIVVHYSVPFTARFDCVHLPGILFALCLLFSSRLAAQEQTPSGYVAPRILWSYIAHAPQPEIWNGCSQPEQGSTEFSGSEDSVWIYFSFDTGSTGQKGVVEWWTPAGKLYIRYPFSMNLGTGCYRWVIDLRNQPAATKPGDWQVRILWDEIEIGRSHFTVNQSAPDYPPVQPPQSLTGTQRSILGRWKQVEPPPQGNAEPSQMVFLDNDKVLGKSSSNDPGKAEPFRFLAAGFIQLDFSVFGKTASKVYEVVLSGERLELICRAIDFHDGGNQRCLEKYVLSRVSKQILLTPDEQKAVDQLTLVQFANPPRL
jgi:hypothetical protein